MTTTVKNIFDQAMSLGVEERTELISRLVDSVSEAPDAGYDEAWAAEIKSRLEDIDSGRAVMIPAEEAIRHIRKRVGLA
jgi:putative addiction module component (TIGR02574 family)